MRLLRGIKALLAGLFRARAKPVSAGADFLAAAVLETRHAAGDDLLTAGLGRTGLLGPPVAFADARRPTPAELRRRAIQMSWKGIAWLQPLAAADTYGALTPVPGREYSAFARVPSRCRLARIFSPRLCWRRGMPMATTC